MKIDRNKPLDVCKIEVCNYVNQKREKEGISINKAFELISAETDIPKNTIKRWFYPAAHEKYDKEVRPHKVVSNSIQVDDTEWDDRIPEDHRQDIMDNFMNDVEKQIMSDVKERKKIKRAERRDERDIAEKLGAEKYDTQPQDENIQILHGDFRELCNDIPAGSVDLVLTDPPYPREFLPLWEDLSYHAERMLKPGGFCVSYSGHMDLPIVLTHMTKHLDYYWMFCLYHKGPTMIVHPVNVMCKWKPILIFQKPPREKIRFTDMDYIVSEKREKDNHEWQQSESGFAALMDRFSVANDLVVDPFIGGGTTAYVARELNRRCIGMDIDEDAIITTKSRLQGDA